MVIDGSGHGQVSEVMRDGNSESRVLCTIDISVATLMWVESVNDIAFFH